MTPEVDSAGVYFISVADFEWRPKAADDDADEADADGRSSPAPPNERPSPPVP